MRIIGVDPSLSCTGVCVMGQGSVEQIFSIKTKTKDSDYARQRQMADGVLRVLKPDDVLVLEDFAFAAKQGVSGKAAERIEICGMIKYLTPRITGMPFLEARPNHLKIFGAGRAAAHKADVVEAVRMDWRQPVANDDEADAYVLAQLARVSLFRPEPLYIGKKRQAVDKFELWKGNPAALYRLRFLL